MSNESKYKDPVIKKYFDLLDQTMPNVFRRYYYGDPIKIPSSLLPACIIAKRSTRIGQHNNVEDEHDIRLLLTVITDIRGDIDSEAGSDGLVAGVNSLYNIIEGRDENYELKADTILGTLRGNIDVDQELGLWTDLGEITSADYGMVIGKRDPEAWSVEGEVDFIAKFHQIR